jgi:hypothetical protein
MTGGAGAFVSPPYRHDGFEETVHAPESDFTFMIDGVAHELATGLAGFVGRGQVPQLRQHENHRRSVLVGDYTGKSRPAKLSGDRRGLGGVTRPPGLDALFGVMTRQATAGGSR